MKPNAGQIVFLIIGLIAGYGLCALSNQMRGEARTPTSEAAVQEQSAPKPLAPVPPSRLVPPRRPTSDAATVAKPDTKADNVESPPEATPRIWVESTDYDTGIVPNNEKTVKAIKVANKGKAPLVISKVQTSCGCVSAKMKDTTVPPDSDTTLDVTIDPKKIHGFTSKKTVTIVSNDPENAQLKVTVTTKIKPEFVLEPENIEFGEVEKGVVAEASVLFRQLSEEPVEVIDAKPWGGVGGLTFAVEKIPSDQWAKPGYREYRVNVKLSPELSPGPFTGRFKIQTTCKRMPFVSCLAKANIQAFYSITPQNVLLQSQNTMLTRSGTAARHIQVSADRPFEVTDVSASDESIIASLRPGEVPNTVFIDLELKPDAQPGTWNHSVAFNVKSGEKTYRERVPVRVLVRKMKLSSPVSPAESSGPGRERDSGPLNVAAPSGGEPVERTPSLPFSKRTDNDAEKP